MFDIGWCNDPGTILNNQFLPTLLAIIMEKGLFQIKRVRTNKHLLHHSMYYETVKLIESKLMYFHSYPLPLNASQIGLSLFTDTCLHFRHLVLNKDPCISTTFLDPATICKPSTFCVITVNCRPDPSSSKCFSNDAMDKWAFNK